MPREMWNTLGSAGMLLVDFPEQYGASGASFEICQMIQEEALTPFIHALPMFIKGS